MIPIVIHWCRVGKNAIHPISRVPCTKARASNKSIYNLNGDYFFGVAIPYICLQLETLENAVFLGLIMFPRSQRYKFKYVLPSSKAVLMVKNIHAPSQ